MLLDWVQGCDAYNAWTLLVDDAYNADHDEGDHAFAFVASSVGSIGGSHVGATVVGCDVPSYDACVFGGSVVGSNVGSVVESVVGSSGGSHGAPRVGSHVGSVVGCVVVSVVGSMVVSVVTCMIGLYCWFCSWITLMD